MTLVIESINANGEVTNTPVDASGGGQLNLAATPGTTYRIIDESGRPIGSGPRVVQIDGNLIIDNLPSGESIEITGFFTACTPENPCTLSLEELGGGPGSAVTPTSEPVAALTQGGFLMNAVGTALPQEPGHEFNWRPIAAGGAGVVILAGVAGGGGGGGGSTPTDTTPPVTPTIKSTTTNSTTPVIEGTAEAGSTVNVSIDIGGTGQRVDYQTTTDANGNWAIDTATAAPVTGTFPATGLPTTAPSPLGVSSVDAAGNLSSPLTTQISIDTTPPAATATLTGASDSVAPVVGAIANGGFTNDDSPTITGTLDLALADGEAVEIVRDGEVVGEAIVSNLVWQFTDSSLADGAHTYSARVVDAAGNTTAATTQIAFTVDLQAPVAPTISAIATDDIVNLPEATAGVTVTGTGPANGTVEVTWAGTAARTVLADGAGAWSTVYSAAQLPADGIRIVTATSTDEAGNRSTDATRSVEIDQADASLEITSSVAGATNDPVTITFTFEEPITGFTASDVVVSNATAGTLVPAGDGLTFTMVVTPLANSDTTATIAVAANAAQDAQGNGSTARSLDQDFDTDRPGLTISSSSAGETNDPVTLTFVFDEAVTGFVAGDITATSGAPSNFVAQPGGTTYTALLTPATNAEITSTISVAANAAIDAVGNGNTADSTTQAFDTERPSLTITDNVAAANATGPVTFTFTFSESVTGFAVGDIAVTGGTAGALNGSGDTYTLVVNPTGASGTIDVDVAAGVATDAAGNTNTSAMASQDFIQSAPTVTITDDEPGAVANGPVTYTFTFNEAVTGFAVGDIALTNGTAGTFSTVTTGLEYTLVVIPTADTEDALGVTVAANAALNGSSVGNAATSATPQNFDTLAPSVVIIDDTTGVTNDDVTYTFTWSEAVTDFTFADITPIINGSATLGDFSGTGSTYTLVVTPDTDTDDDMTVTVAADASVDAAGNGSAVTVSSPQAIDTLAPDIGITGTAGTAAGASFDITFTFDEAVTGFSVADIDVTPSAGVSAPTLGVLTPNGSGDIYTLTVTPVAAENGTFTFDVDADVADDLATNGNTAATAFVQTFDSAMFLPDPSSGFGIA